MGPWPSDTGSTDECQRGGFWRNLTDHEAGLKVKVTKGKKKKQMRAVRDDAALACVQKA